MEEMYQIWRLHDSDDSRFGRQGYDVVELICTELLMFWRRILL
jgi:hypothetical protein